MLFSCCFGGVWFCYVGLGFGLFLFGLVCSDVVTAVGFEGFWFCLVLNEGGHGGLLSILCNDDKP